MDDTKADVAAFLVSLAGEDTRGAIALMEQMGVSPGSRAAAALAGLAGFSIGMTMQLLEQHKVPKEEARSEARRLIATWFREGSVT